MRTETEVRHEEIPRLEAGGSRAASLAGRLLAGLTLLCGWSARQLARPRIRTAVIGVLLILIGAVIVSSAFWAFLLVVIGLIMVVTTWVGSRLEGRFVIEWNEQGAGFEMQARFKSAQVASLEAIGNSSRDVDPAQTIEGEAHTVELDLDDLKALIAAAENIRLSDVGSQTDLVANAVGGADGAAEPDPTAQTV